ncbi:hypothetical protein J7E78_01350 [Paenibacillus polymyxa]|uniref:hypothetical protein n=1 Tax=Paenibacillus polymyxa TaxID=1406 RepID=UPI001BE99E30|nr:hypothetical protein [Paenibacillus polymyxa]MBT2282198.1 hypothetical protein [Paenibacillus polymyxa]
MNTWFFFFCKVSTFHIRNMDFQKKGNQCLFVKGWLLEMAQEHYFLTWVESDKAEIVEEMLDERKVPIDMLPTPEAINDQEVFVCKDCFELLTAKEMVLLLSELPFPDQTKCFTSEGEMLFSI